MLYLFAPFQLIFEKVITSQLYILQLIRAVHAATPHPMTCKGTRCPIQNEWMQLLLSGAVAIGGQCVGILITTEDGAQQGTGARGYCHNWHPHSTVPSRRRQQEQLGHAHG
jgi:hypothetical protein